MNYQHISEIAGPGVARTIDEDSDSINYSTIDAEALDELARGAHVLGIETIDYPNTDGLIFYLNRPAGGVVALLIETDADEMGVYGQLLTKAAAVQEADT